MRRFWPRTLTLLIGIAVLVFALVLPDSLSRVIVWNS